MHVLGWIFFGLIVGVVAKLLMPGRDPGGLIVTILLGISGSLFGGLIGKLLGGEGMPAGWLGSIVCAFLLLLAYRLFVERMHPQQR